MLSEANFVIAEDSSLAPRPAPWDQRGKACQAKRSRNCAFLFLRQLEPVSKESRSFFGTCFNAAEGSPMG